MNPRLTGSRRALLLGAATLILSHHAPARPSCEPALQLLGGDLPPLTSPTHGALTEKVQRLARAAGYSNPPTWLPWPRALMQARVAGQALVFPMARTAEREHEWQWLAHLGTEEYVLLVRRDAVTDPYALRDTATLARLHLGVTRDSAQTPALMREGFQLLDFAPSNRANARKLGMGRIQAWGTTRHMAEFWLAQEQVDPQSLWPMLPRGKIALHLAASLDVCAEDVALWRAAERWA